MRFGIVAVVIFCTVALLVPHTADACTCISAPASDQQAKGSPLLIAARIATTLPLRSVSTRTDWLPGSDVAAIDGDVLTVIRGKEVRQRVRIWDQFVGGSCSLQLEKLQQGMLVVLSIDPAEQRLREVWESVGIQPAENDYVWGTCGQPWRVFKTDAELQRFIESHRQSSATTGALKDFLQTYLSDAVLGQDKTTQYSSAPVDLDGDGMKETVVYISGQDWCGSGGCHLLVLKLKDTSYEVVGRTSITRLPIRVLATKTHGWRDIGVWVRGGGIQPGYEALLPFDGTSYPRGATTPPARPVAAGTKGKVLIPTTAQGAPLYR